MREACSKKVPPHPTLSWLPLGRNEINARPNTDSLLTTTERENERETRRQRQTETENVLKVNAFFVLDLSNIHGQKTAISLVQRITYS